MRVLFITSSLPYPPSHGGKTRAWHLLQQVARHHDVTLLSLLDSAGESQFVPYLRQYCSRVEAVAKRRRRPRGKLFLRLLKTMLKGQPPRNGIDYHEEMEYKIREVTRSQPFDIIQIEQSFMAPYVEFIDNAHSAARLISLYDVGAIQIGRIFKIQSGRQQRLLAWLDALFLSRWEPTYLTHHFDKCIVVSPADEALLRRANPALDLAVVPNGVDTVQYTLLPESSGSKKILFVGDMHYPPNVDGAVFFCKEIFPLIKQHIPDAKLLIVGSEPANAVRALAGDDVQVTGYVNSVVPYYQESGVSVVPLRAGGGTRLKILESMALGRPVVSTVLGCEGLAVTHGENILIADTPADFANQTAQVLNGGKGRQRLIANGRRLVEATYDWQIIAQSLLQVYDEIIGRRQGGLDYSASKEDSG